MVVGAVNGDLIATKFETKKGQAHLSVIYLDTYGTSVRLAALRRKKRPAYRGRRRSRLSYHFCVAGQRTLSSAEVNGEKFSTQHGGT